MKKLNVAILLVVTLFIFTCCISPVIVTESDMITLTLPEYRVSEYEIKLQIVELEEIKAVYYEEPITVKAEVSSNAQNSVNNNDVVDNVSRTTTVSRNLGNIGRLEIPTVGYSAALNNGLVDTAYAQIVVDAYDSACYIGYNGYTTYIGDHYYQGFANMKNSVPGSTFAYIYETDGSVTTYICVAKYYNCVKSGYVYDENGINIYFSGYDLAMVTCNDSTSTSVTVTYWNKI
ncbi:MAG: hypothetical protein J6A15_09650 [Clostridia bacterium]|nr:hypothetical protein [Clostridia bacterium]